jgi:hypothetical protein
VLSPVGHHGQFRGTNFHIILLSTIDVRVLPEAVGSFCRESKTVGLNTKKTRTAYEISTDELSLFATELPAEVFPEIVHRIRVIKTFSLEQGFGVSRP